jgi:hypothetical protein
VRFVRLEIKLSHFSTRGNHLIRYNIAVNIERGSDIRAWRIIFCCTATGVHTASSHER